jgi:glycine/D-amino acid oxidase-like deaminating enzyme
LLHSDREKLATVQAGARAGGVDSRLLWPDELGAVLHDSMSPDGYHGLFATSGGVLDIHQLCQALARAARDAGAHIAREHEVTGLLTRAGRVRGVATAAGEVVADTVVIAGGAWSSELGREMGVPLELRRVRRHLALLEPERPLPPKFPVVWCVAPEVYFRPELDRVLVSPCDASVVEGTLAQSDIDALSPLWEKLAHLGTGLERARVSRHWACLRTFAPDNRPVIGLDPRLDGLAWLVGLGGFGMTAGVAAGEELARVLAGDAESERFSVTRLLAPRT